MEKSTTGSIDAVRGVCDVNVFDAERVGRARNMVFVSLSAMISSKGIRQRNADLPVLVTGSLFPVMSLMNEDYLPLSFTFARCRVQVWNGSKRGTRESGRYR